MSASSVLAQVLVLAAGGASAAAAQDAPVAIEEIIVTAQKREEKLQDVPVSISVVTGAKVAELHASNLQDIQGYVPNMTVLSSGVNPVVYIRGFGSGPNNVAFDQEVSVYSDGIYGGRGAQFAAPFFDIQRMEVLRGPQGALFGKNTAAGAINIVSAGPTSELEGGGTISYNFNKKGFDGSAYVGGPITDDFGMRLAVKFVDQDGWLKNLATGGEDPHAEQQLARLTFRYAPSDRLNVSGKFEYGKLKNEGGVTMSGSLTQPTSFSDERYIGAPYGPAPYKEHNGITTHNAVVTVNYDVAGHTLTSVTGYSEFKTSRLSAYDEFNPDRTVQPNGGNALFSNGFPEVFEQYSQELRVASPVGQKLEYIVGVYYDQSDYHLHQDSYYRRIAGTITGHQSTDFYQIATTYSVFGQATYHLSESLRAIGSLRWSQTNKKGTFRSRTVSGAALNPITRADGKLEEDYTDPSVTVQYDITPDVMVYATYGRGSKSGGFVSNTYGMVDSRFQFKPERSTNYEAGIKSTLAQGRLVANAAVFSTEFKDLQQSAYDPDRRTFLTRNAASATAEGVELDVQWLPIDSLQLSAGIAYLDAKFDDYPGAPCLATETLAQCNSADPVSLANHNVKGLPLMFAPKWSGNISGKHTMMLGGNLKLVTSVTALFRSKYYVVDTYSPIYGLQDGWVKWDARIQLGAEDDRWNVAVVGRNLSDERTVAAAIRFPPAITATGRSISWMDEYRSIAVEGSYKFW